MKYWNECLSTAADECGLKLTDEQLGCLAGAAESAHENYGLAFYSPPVGDRIAEIERKWEAKVEKMQQESERYRRNAETAIKEALHQRRDESVSIGEDGEVFRHGGRTERIQ